ncbi:4-phosphoerythronate dehydrogenase [Gracilimonas mengyeensis]|uniref:Erythronate-4-phosphate dehydrogenase n=1 Tax=Gracilimonas mengyeensis TaxID=1302730 RepID=A0A521FGU5_9BACT|nr:4-phosphoerythronate dehydrogenase [Gracilimonas mengyeensis]SMO95428.1 erythronate-4-phosphate dehydrogenase [Gracilimonas mengyeensis]
MIHISADQNLYKIKELVPPETKLNLYDPSNGIPDLNDTDALLVRTVTQINANTLPQPPQQLRFIGTGSSGTDHIDEEYLQQNGIRFSDANGCNARAVAEYVITALLFWREEQQLKEIPGKVGVIGVGKAGSAVVSLLEKFGIDCVAYDPPRERRDPGFTSATIDEVLACEILTFHVPLNRKGEFATYHWLNEEKLAGRQYQLIINAARGGVIDELELMKAYVEERVQGYILDVWEEEPDFNTEIAKHAFLATPHIAGYSEQSKINATKMVCDRLAEYFNLEPSKSQENNDNQIIDLEDYLNYDLKKLLARFHPMKEYDAALRDLSDRPDKKVLFQNLRNEMPYRYEYPQLKIRKEVLDQFAELQLLGIQEI